MPTGREHPIGVGADWWRQAVIYQVYLRSFCDANGDGVGDISGVASRLPYLKRLGVDALWINPWYRSPMVDGGYDVEDFRDIDPLFGTVVDAVDLVTQAHEHGLRVIVDLVPNHTSDRHRWFRAALDTPSGSAERERYIFRPGRGQNGDEPPNDWVSAFAGPAWTRVTSRDGCAGEWYLHLFASEQPDLNWDSADVQNEMEDVMTFWLDRGVDGFRIDVAHGLIKAPGLPDVGYAELGELPKRVAEPHHVADHPHWDRDEVHAIFRRWRALQERSPQLVLVGEVVIEDLDRVARYVRPDELHTAFNFPFMRAGWDADSLRQVVDATIASLTQVGATSTWALGNHDVTRVATRYGDGAVGRRRALAAHLFMLGLPGSAYIYQGDELCLPEVHDIDPKARQDPIFLRSGGTDVGRDGCRVPLPWTSGAFCGFGPPDGSDPWLPQPSGWCSLSVEVQEGDVWAPLSVIRAALAARREFVDHPDKSLRWLASAPDVLHFARGSGRQVMLNLGHAPAALPSFAHQVVVSSAPITGGVLPVDAACWIRTDG